MDQENDIFEYEWWKVFLGFSLLSVFSVALIINGYLGLQILGDPIDSYKNLAFIRLCGLIFFGSEGLLISILKLWSLRSVPKTIIFKSDRINVIYPIGKEKVFLYEDVSRIFIRGDITKRNQWSRSSFFPFRVKVYFLDNSIKIMFNPDRLINFPALLDGFKNKGLGSLIEQK